MANGFNVPPVNLNMYTPTGSQMQLSPVKNVLGSQQPMPYSSAGISSILQGIQQRTPQREAFAGVPFPRPTMLPQQGVPVPQPRPTDMPLSPPSGLDQLRAAQLRMPARGTPESAGLAAAGRQLLAAGGWQDRPVTLGQALGSGLEAFNVGAQEERQRQAEAQRQSFLDQLEIDKLLLQAQKAMQPDPTSIEKNALAMGLERGTPEFNDFIMRAATKPQTSVFIGGDEQKKLAYQEALNTRKELKESVASTEAMMPRLMLAMDLLESGVETGRVASALLPVKQWMRSLNLLSDEQIENLTDQELIDSATAALTPAQRVAGSGTTSDRDMNYYQRATVNMANTPEANRVIAAMQIQLNKYNKKRLSLFDDYIQDKGHDFGFGDYADEKLGSFYQRVEDQDQFQRLIDDGLIEEGDVFYNGLSGEFDIFDKEAFQ